MSTPHNIKRIDVSKLREDLDNAAKQLEELRSALDQGEEVNIDDLGRINQFLAAFSYSDSSAQSW